jgi:hypothetical protein
VHSSLPPNSNTNVGYNHSTTFCHAVKHSARIIQLFNKRPTSQAVLAANLRMLRYLPTLLIAHKNATKMLQRRDKDVRFCAQKLIKDVCFCEHKRDKDATKIEQRRSKNARFCALTGQDKTKQKPFGVLKIRRSKSIPEGGGGFWEGIGLYPSPLSNH